MFCNFISFQNLNICNFIYCSLTKSCPTLQPHGLQHVRLPCLSLSPRVCSNSWSLSPWCHLISSLTPFSSCPHLNLFQHQGLSNESALCIMWPKYWSFSFSISPCPSDEYLGLISFRIDWLNLLAVQGTLKSLLQYENWETSILWHSAFFMVQLSAPYMTTGKTIALTIWTLLYIDDIEVIKTRPSSCRSQS